MLSKIMNAPSKKPPIQKTPKAPVDQRTGYPKSGPTDQAVALKRGGKVPANKRGKR
jgi:hypothetical protein